MMNQEDLLQERLARLENGESLEACLAGLPEEASGLLKIAAMFHSVRFPSRTAEGVAAQRANLLRAASERRASASPGALKAAPRSRLRWTPPALRMLFAEWLAALPKPVALALAGMLVISAIAVALSLRQPPQAGSNVVQNPQPEPTAPHFTQYLPALNNVLTAPDPQTAVLSDARGIVEVQANDGTWTAVKAGQSVTAGQRVRTGNLSSATLLLYDGSQARLGPVTEVSVDELDARTDGPRVALLTQWIGETDHDVTPSSDAASRYEVRTPSGTGAAKGTSFHVSVSVSLVTRISVDEGSVAATSLNVTVIVIAGQVTTIHASAPPAEPVFRVTGEGVVSQIGETWRIGGLEFATDANTVVAGNPQIGDFVSVEGHLLADGTRVADLIVLLRRAQENTFSFTGTVDSIGDTEWMVSGRAISLTAETEMDAGIEVGDDVHVEGVILAGGTLQAERIRLVDEAGLPFEFTGVVESITGNTWTISGISIAVDDNTEITGDPGVGDIVKVEGRILDDNVWLADEIKLAEEDERRFEFTGIVEAIDPWVVSGIHFDTNDQTEIDPEIEQGSRVKVEGRVLDDGIWLAEEIELLDDDQAPRFEFIGEVSSIDPWIIGGLDITVNDETEIDDVNIGDTVRVSGIILPDGTLLARRIKLLDDDLGCMDIVTVIVRIDGNRIVLGDGQAIELTDEIEIIGELRASAVVIIRVCIGEDGTIVVISITIIFIPPPPTPIPPPPPSGGKVTLCHIPPGNPGARHTIEVDPPAVAAHLGHGDTLGPCGGGDGDDDEGDD